MTFKSILFKDHQDRLAHQAEAEPAFFADLNLDQIVAAVTAGRKEYDLKPFFYTPLKTIDAIEYRQEIAKDLENPTLLQHIKAFSQKMLTMRRYLAMIEKLYYKLHQQGWFLEAVILYCEAVSSLAADLGKVSLNSRGLSAFHRYLVHYIDSGEFTSLSAETEKLKADLSTVTYCMIIGAGKVKVRKFEQEINYSIEVENTFEKFKQGAVKDYTTKNILASGMNHVQAAILEFVAKLYPEIFSSLNDYCFKNRGYLAETISVFDQEIQFYVAYLEHVAKLKKSGLNFCYPKISSQSKEVHNYGGFDLALAYKLIKDNSPVICNDFFLKGKERIFVVSGPNQGGKTTFARSFGQLQFLACLGCPVPGREGQFFLFDKIFTHFEKEENIQNLRGKLQDDLIRIQDILNLATPKSIIIMNEIFTSTTLKDAFFLSKKIIETIIDLDLLSVLVTFIDELSAFSEKTVSMVSTVVADDPASRTYKILRKPADGLAYAIAIAEKYELTYDQLSRRLT